MIAHAQKKPPTKQERSLLAEKKVLDGAAELLKSGGFESAQIATISKVAGVSVGSVYHHFGSKDGIFKRLIDCSYEISHSRLMSIDETGKDFDDLLLDFVNVLCLHVQDNAALYRSMVELTRHKPDIWDPFRKLRIETVSALQKAIGPLLKERGVDDAHSRISLAHQVMVAVLTHAALLESEPIRLEGSDLPREMFNLAKSILLSEIDTKGIEND